MDVLTYYKQEGIKNRWGYMSDVGYIAKSTDGTEKDAQQDQEIEANKQQIEETNHSLQENERRDDQQQSQIDANTTNITRIEGEMPTLDIEGTTLVIGTKGEN